MSKQFIEISRLESYNRNERLNHILENEIPELLEDQNIFNLSVVLTFSSNISSDHSWSNIKSEDIKSLRTLLHINVIQYILYCVERFAGKTAISQYPKLETVIGITRDTLTTTDIANIVTENSLLVPYNVKRRTGARETQHGMISVVLKNTRHFSAYNVVGFPCGLLSKNQKVFDFFKSLDQRIASIYIDGVSNSLGSDTIASSVVQDNPMIIKINKTVEAPNIIRSNSNNTTKMDKKMTKAERGIERVKDTMSKYGLINYKGKIYCLRHNTTSTYHKWKGKKGKATTTAGTFKLVIKQSIDPTNLKTANIMRSSEKDILYCVNEDEEDIGVFDNKDLNPRIIEFADCMYHIGTNTIFPKTDRLGCRKYFENISDEMIGNDELIYPKHWLSILENSGYLDNDILHRKLFELLMGRKHRDGVLTLVGDPGSGKSTLIDVFRKLFPKDKIVDTKFTNSKFNVIVDDEIMMIMDECNGSNDKHQMNKMLEGYFGIVEQKFKDPRRIDFRKMTMVIISNDLEWIEHESTKQRLMPFKFRELPYYDSNVRDLIMEEAPFVLLWLAKRYFEFGRTISINRALSLIEHWKFGVNI